MKRIRYILLILVLLFQLNLEAQELSIPSIINSGMVLQRNAQVSIWGTATPGSEVSIRSGWKATALVPVNEDGKWTARLNTGEAGGPYSLNITSGGEEITLKDVYIGEVWLCSGQSNMEMPLTGWPPNDLIEGSEKEIAEADNQHIRMFTVAKNVSPEPEEDCQGEWLPCTSENAPIFSATAYFFGKMLNDSLDIPIGLIHSSWGGTPAESWAEAGFLDRLPSYKGFSAKRDKAEQEFDVFITWMEELEHQLIPINDPEFYAKMDKHEAEMKAVDLDDSEWDEMKVPSLWENEALPDFDGITWFRTSFMVPKNLAGKEMVLELGPIDDMDICYLNGKEIGQHMESGFYSMKRVYKIPKGLLKLGENVLAVCVIDNQGGGGIYSSEDIKITDNSNAKLILSGNWKFKPVAQIVGDEIYFFDDAKSFAERPPLSMTFGAYTPSALYNGMIQPLVPYTLNGAIWYQGESNVGRGYEYRSLFPMMINSWRNAWGLGDFPFYYVQIAPYDYREDVASQTAEVREAQLLALSLPNTGMIVTMDVGNPTNIHPANKKDIGARLARWALHNEYGYEKLEVSGPLYKSLKIKGSKAIVSFSHTEGGLLVKGDELTHIEIAGSDRVYHPAEAGIVSEDRLIVWSHEVKEPVAVRYGWDDKVEPNLFNGAGLPASPFRTDNWKRLSE